jgi:hypothetical protein
MRCLVLALVALTCSACGLRTYFAGPKFADYESVPPGKARLYVYRPDWHWLGPALEVDVDGVPLADLDGATYVSVLVTPRTFKVWARLRETDRFDRVAARAGHTVFCLYTDASVLYCSEDRAEHEKLKHCRRAGPEGEWDP